MRKGRSILHKNLEDNYGAVIVANHEALAQVLEQVNHGPFVPPVLRGLKSTVNLRWSDFTINDCSRAVVSGRRAFHIAMWGPHYVTLILTVEQPSLISPSFGAFALSPITEFSDLVPSNFLPIMPTVKPSLMQATISVLPYMHVDTIQSKGVLMSKRPIQTVGTEQWRESAFLLLQLVNGLKYFQAQGIEEAPLALSNFVLCRDIERDAQARLYVLQELGETVSATEEEEQRGSLCQCALTASTKFLPSTKLTSLISDILSKERAGTLSQVKSIIEFSLWGPSDVALGVPVKDRELALQRWLDLERATVLHGLVRTRIQLTVYEEHHLLFLVRSNAKIMCDASILLDQIESRELYN